MNKRERLEATLNGEVVDRIPASFWRHWPGDDQRPDDLAEALIHYQDHYDWDFIRVVPDDSYSIRDWGVQDRWQGAIDGTRTFTDRVIHAPEDWLTLKVLDPAEGSLGQHLIVLEKLQKRYTDEVPFIVTILSPLTQASLLSGDSSLVLHMRQNAGQVHHALQTITDTTVRFLQECKERGVAGIYYIVNQANYLKMSEAEYEVFGRPYDYQILAGTKADLWLNVLHISGDHIMFDMVADYPLQVFNWNIQGQSAGLAAGLKRVKGAVCGGINYKDIHSDNPDNAIQQAKEAFQKSGGTRYILGAGSNLLVTTPEGNLRKLRNLIDTLEPVTE